MKSFNYALFILAQILLLLMKLPSIKASTLQQPLKLDLDSTKLYHKAFFV